MPFSPTKSCSDWNKIYQFIKDAVEEARLGYQCERSKIRGGLIIKDILDNLYKADLVIADLTDQNPNVFYELGVRHTLSNKTILIAQDISYIPSDLHGYGIIVYEPNTKEGFDKFKKEIKRLIKEIENNPERIDSPVREFLKIKNYALFDHERNEILRQLSALYAELFDNAATLIKNKKHYFDGDFYLLGVFTKCIENLFIYQYITDIELHTILKQLLLVLQKLDYFAKLLTYPNKDFREAHKDLYFLHIDIALKLIDQAKDKVMYWIQEISNNKIALEEREPIWRSILWEVEVTEQKLKT